MADQAQALLAAVAALPPTINPYTFTIELLRSQMIPKVKTIMFDNAYISMGLSGLGLLFSIGAIATKISYGAAWLVKRRYSSSGGTVYTINSSLWLCVLITIYFIINIASMYFLLDAFKYGNSPVPIEGAQGALWIPISLCGWTETHGMIVATYLSKDRQRSSTATGKRSYTSSKSMRQFPAWLLNTLFFGFYIVQICVIFPIFGIAAKHVANAWDAFETLRDGLAAGAAVWQTGQPFQLDPAALPVAIDYISEGTKALDWLQRGFLAFAVIIGIVLAVFVPAAVAYIGMLSKQMRSYRQHDSSKASKVSSGFAHGDHLSHVFRYILLEGALVTIVTLIMLGLCVWTAIKTHSLLRNGSQITVIYGLVIYAFDLVAVPLNAVLAYRSIRPLLIERRSKAHSPKSFISAVSVVTMVERFVEGDLKESKPVRLSHELAHITPAIVTFQPDDQDLDKYAGEKEDAYNPGD